MEHMHRNRRREAEPLWCGGSCAQYSFDLPMKAVHTSINSVAGGGYAGALEILCNEGHK